ncbi:hypothetical protein HAX54_026699, partial [Datura stramonium]|nr:hypothetical protein [Datura stramonium]
RAPTQQQLTKIPVETISEALRTSSRNLLAFGVNFHGCLALLLRWKWGENMFYKKEGQT